MKLKTSFIILAITIASCGQYTSVAEPTASAQVFAAPITPSVKLQTPLPSPTPSTAPTSSPSVTPSPLPTDTTAPTQTNTVIPSATSTSIPPSATSTTQAQVVIVQPTVSSSTPIQFQYGATTGAVTGVIGPGQVLMYSVSVLANQPARINLGSPNNDVTMSISGQDGSDLLSPANRSAFWQGYFTKTQVYLIKVYGGAGTTNFDLSLNISARISLPSGTTQATLTGKTVGGFIVSYALYANQGQSLNVTINTAPEIAAFTIWGFSDGQPYAHASSGTTAFSMQLPATQDYIIDVVPQGGSVENYTLSISIK